MKILFISRAYPPITGGIENQNYELSVWLPRHAEVKTIANKKGKVFLPLFLPYAFFKSLFISNKYDVILLGDGVLGIIGWPLKTISRKPIVSIVHGLDLTFKNPIYQKLWIGFFLKKLDKLFAVGNETIKAGISRGIPREKFTFIPNGVDPEKNIENYSKKDLEKTTKIDLTDKKVILTLGRLAKRKGVAWFVKNVMPKLPENTIYIITGEGIDKENIKKTIIETNSEDRVKLFGNATDEEKKILLNTADIFVQPNIPVAGDMEGFGIVVLEAASCKRVVLASRLEGLQDAIISERNGFLIEPEDAKKYVKKISTLLEEDTFRKEFGEKARNFVIENYSWEKISKQYIEEINKVIKK